MADNTLINMLMGAWPGGASPVFGVQTPQEQGLQQPSILDNAASSMINSAATLPQRAIQNSQFALNTGAYDPGPTLEAAMLPMGASPFGTGAEGSAVFGAGPIRPLAIKDAVEAPAVADDMVRLYRGGGNNQGGPKWVTTNRKYAEGYTTPGLAHSPDAGSYLQYADIPAADPRVQMPAGQSTHSFEAAADIADQLKPFYRPKQ